MSKKPTINRPKLAVLKPRVEQADLSIGARMPRASGTTRMRGRKLQERRRRWFALHPLCVHCEQRGRATPATELDHVVPLFRGGADDETNLCGLCGPCHALKTREDMRSTHG